MAVCWQEQGEIHVFVHNTGDGIAMVIAGYFRMGKILTISVKNVKW